MIWSPLVKIGLRQARFNLFRTVLLVLGIALGVAGVVAIDIARTSVSKSFELSTAAITARATHQIVGSNFKVPQSLFVQIRTRLGINRSAPVISSLVKVKELNDTPLTLMGIDPFSEQNFREVTVRSGSADPALSGLLNSPSGILLSQTLAQQYGLEQKDGLTLLFGARKVKVVIEGFIDSSDAATNTVYQGLILADISLAQEILGFNDDISRIDLILTDNAMVEKIRALLPPSIVLVETRQQNRAVRQLSRSFETSLTAFSMLALFMGIFLIYNTVSFSITRRRKLNGTLRALGATRNNIFWTIIAEVMIYALVGSIVGIFLGILMGKGAVHAVCSTVSDMYFVLTVSQTHIAVFTLLKGFVAGIVSSLAASVVPAMTAARTQPVTLMQRSAAESALKKYLRPLSFAGFLMLCTAIFGLNFLTLGPGLDFAGIFLMFSGAALLTPMVVLFSVQGILIVFKRPLGVMMKMALRNIVRSLSRTSVLIASLMVVTAVYIGIDIMTASFRFSIIDWVDGHIGGDIHVSSSDTLKRELSPELLSKIQALPQVAAVSAYNIHRIFSRASGEVHIFSYVQDLSRKHWSWMATEETRLPELLDQGWIAVSEIFADANHVEAKKGAQVTLETLEGPVSFKVAGIFRDFFMGGGRVVVNRDLMKQFWGHDDITAMQVFLHPKEAVAPVLDRIKTFVPATARVVSGASIKQGIIDVFNRTFLITSALQALTAIVALTGILNSVMALLLERTRELGILRACGAEPRQVGRLLLSECGLSGLFSGVMALPLGVCLAWVLIDIVNRRSFGWTYDMVISPGVFIQAVTLACVAAIVAGIFPAVKAGRTDVKTALHME